MNDKELLELAAKAAGIENIWGYDEDHKCLMLDSFYGRKIWNPLADDGDALRLAVKLDFRIDVDTVRDYCAVFAIDFAAILHYDEAGDPYATTRRAIVRAAAEMGKGMR